MLVEDDTLLAAALRGYAPTEANFASTICNARRLRDAAKQAMVDALDLLSSRRLLATPKALTRIRTPKAHPDIACNNRVSFGGGAYAGT